jgi:hypothetical protein
MPRLRGYRKDGAGNFTRRKIRAQGYAARLCSVQRHWPDKENLQAEFKLGHYHFFLSLELIEYVGRIRDRSGGITVLLAAKITNGTTAK